MRTQQKLPSLFMQAQVGRAREIAGIVTAPRDVFMGSGKDVYAGQLCFIARSQLFDGLHAWRLGDQVTVARTQYVGRDEYGNGLVYLSWMDSEVDRVMVSLAHAEHLGCVVGCYSNDNDPLLWAYSN